MYNVWITLHVYTALLASALVQGLQHLALERLLPQFAQFIRFNHPNANLLFER